MVDDCLAERELPGVDLQLDGSWRVPSGAHDNEGPVTTCIATARRAQLEPFVAPSALLFLGNPGDGVQPGVELTAAGVSRIATAAAAVLVLAVGVSAVIATRLVRPVHALTDAAQRMRDGDWSARVTVRDEGEIGRLATAFNAMSEHLERMERQRKEMVSDVSHELRTPLSNVRGWLEAAHDGVAELDPELICSLVEEILLLQHIVDDLQELALADAGRLRLNPEPVRVADLLDQVATAHRGRAEAAGLRITVDVDGDLRLVADPVRLRQAVGNLVTNALRFTPPGGRVALRAHADGNGVRVEVSDTGVGIAPDALPHVFDRFWRADKSRSRRSGGSGLGLAIVRSLTEAQGGTAAVTSTVGGGTTFTLRFPAGRAAGTVGRGQ
ncbi:MAG TPA: HAMP domain-containing sensor histidine kinase [Thermomonospora sp.]|nr:HAMP domain-containing sensor histidine kinase [Thermomonospora sp.]